MESNFDLDTILMQLAEKNSVSNFTVRDAVTGIQVFGGIGSGKTSGSGKTLALKYLANDFGGLVLTAKVEEVEIWKEYCRLTNREKDLIIVEPGCKNYFNFLEYESKNLVDGISPTENILQVLKTVIRAAEEKSGGKSDDPFWEVSLDLLIDNLLSLCQLAFGTITIQKIYDMALSIPKTGSAIDESPKRNSYAAAFLAAQKKVNLQVDALIEKLTPDQSKIAEDPECIEQLILENIPDAETLKSIDQFFNETFRNLSEKTRSIVELCFIGFLYRLRKEPVYSLFCKFESNYTPEDCLDGKIIILNLPVKKYYKTGSSAQIMYKYIWQRAMERRDVNENPRPVFLWADEAQLFLHEFDSEFQATARSSKIITTYLSQNLPNYHANMGGTKSEYKVKAFLGTLANKFFHANADIETNRYASELIGDSYIQDNSKSQTVSGNFSSSRSQSLKLERVIRPEKFVSLRTGGPDNLFQVQCYLHKQGTPFPDGQNFKKITFSQINNH